MRFVKRHSFYCLKFPKFSVQITIRVHFVVAVFDKGCGAILLILLHTLLGWLPGTIVALIICLADKKKIGDQ